MTSVTESIATLYRTGPAAEPSAVELAMFRGWLRSQWDRISARIKTTPQDITLRQAWKRYVLTGELVVSSANNSHPYLTWHENIMFRAVHDWHHIQSGADDSLLGEMKTYWFARSTAPESIWWILRSEIILQAAACIHYGEFQPQKLVRTV